MSALDLVYTSQRIINISLDKDCVRVEISFAVIATSRVDSSRRWNLSVPCQLDRQFAERGGPAAVAFLHVES